MVSKFSKRKKFKIVSVSLEEETLKEIVEFTKNFKTLSRTEIMRFAVEYAINMKTEDFKNLLREIDG
jgi:metal-responsive CopG/Arc/MetJ family transcriptional regulator